PGASEKAGTASKGAGEEWQPLVLGDTARHGSTRRCHKLRGLEQHARAMSSAIGRPPARAIQRLGAPVPAPRSRTTGHATPGLPLVPALEEGPSKRAAPHLVHQPGGRRLLVDVDLLGAEGEGRE